MSEKTRYIDTQLYGVVSGAGWAVPRRSVPHLLIHNDDRPGIITICGESAFKHPRMTSSTTSDWEKPLCANCIKAAAQQELVEQPPLKLRVGDCPVGSEREGKHRPHNWLSQRPRCGDCPPKNPYKDTERCEKRKHPTTAMCTSCKATDPDRHFCDYTVGRSMGIATDFGPCDKPATTLERYKRHQHDKLKWGYLCHLHNEAGEKKRADKDAAKQDAETARWADRDKREDDRRDAFDILVEMARWIAKNRELAAEDEWLSQIAVKLAGNDAAQAALEGKDE